MAFIPVLNTVQSRLQFTEDNGVFAEQVFYNATTGVPTETDLTEIGELWHDWVFEALQLDMTSNWACSGVALRAMNEAEGLGILYTDGFPIDGTNAGSPVPDNVSYTITWGTGLVGRSARGRTYGIGLPANAIINRNRLTDAARASFDGHWNSLLDMMATAGHSLQVVSFQEGGVMRTTGRALPALSASVRFPVATQRRRLA